MIQRSTFYILAISVIVVLGALALIRTPGKPVVANSNAVLVSDTNTTPSFSLTHPSPSQTVWQSSFYQLALTLPKTFSFLEEPASPTEVFQGLFSAVNPDHRQGRFRDTLNGFNTSLEDRMGLVVFPRTDNTAMTTSDFRAWYQQNKRSKPEDLKAVTLKTISGWRVTEADGIGSKGYAYYFFGKKYAYVFESSDFTDAQMTDFLSGLKVDADFGLAKTYSSTKLGIRFQYLSQAFGQNVLVKEIGDTIYVYDQGTQPTDGQSVQVFAKDPSLTLQQAVEKKFLQGYASTDCYVRAGTDTNATPAGPGLASIIAYPIPDANVNNGDDWLINQAKCPEHYSATNGLSYFWTDRENSNTFVFFSIGQYIIPGDAAEDSWHTTLKFTNP